MRVFISGPMTGYAGFNRAAFDAAERTLKSQGHVVLNPAVLTDGLTQAQYMDICAAMVRCADALFMLQGWEASAGARAEYALAEKLGHRILYQAPPEAEPVLYQYRMRPSWDTVIPWTLWEDCSHSSYEDKLRFTDTPDHAGWIYECRQLYTAPPALVVPHEWRLSNAQAFIERYSPPSVEEAALFAWNACRAAVLRSIDLFRKGGNQ